MKLSLAVFASFYQVHASTCNAKEGIPGKNLIQSYTQRQETPALQARRDHAGVHLGDDALPPWALPHNDVKAVLEERRSRTAHALESLLETEPGLEGDVQVDKEAHKPGWLKRLLHIRHAAEQAHRAVQQAHRRFFDTAKDAHHHVSMLAHKKGGPEVITMVYVMTVPVGILSLGFGVLMIVRFAESTGDGEDLEEDKGPSPEEVLQGEPWNHDSSAGDGSLPPIGRLRVPHNSLPPLEETLPPEKSAKGLKKTQSEPHVKGSQGLKKSRSVPDMKAGDNKLDNLHDDLQQALSAVKKGKVDVTTPAHLRFRPFPEKVPPWAVQKKGGGSSNDTSTTVSEDEKFRKERDRKAEIERWNEHLQDEPVAFNMRRPQERDVAIQTESKGQKARSDRRKGHRSRPDPDGTSEADEDGLSADSRETLSATPTDRTSSCRSSLRLAGAGSLAVAQERAVC